MLIELAVGDSYGAAYECLKNPPMPNNLKGYSKHPKHPLPAGFYTDDTQMSIGVCEAMLEGYDTKITKELLADKFVSCFKRDRREGYAGRFYQFLLSVDNGVEFLERIVPNSERNGAAMRSVPIGLLPDLNEVKKLAERQARITHDTDGGVASSQAVAMMAHYFYHNLGPSEAVGEWLSKNLVEPSLQSWTTEWHGWVRVHGMDTAQAVCSLLSRTKKMSDLLQKAIALGGDTDSVAAICMGCAALSSDIENDLQSFPWMYRDIENGPYGLDFLRKLDEQMFAKFPKTQS